MSEGETEVVSVDVTDDASVSTSEIFSDMLRHMMAPLLIGMVFGAIWDLTVMPRIEPNFAPNPVHGAFAITSCISTHLRTPPQHGNEPCWRICHRLAITACILSLVWMFGSYRCILEVSACIAWLFISSFWLQFEFPPFRYGLWHAIVDIKATEAI